MASSGIVAIRFIIEVNFFKHFCIDYQANLNKTQQNTHTTRLIPLIGSGITSRSKEIRRNCSEFINQLLQTWETHHLEKHVQLLQTCIKKGIADADQEARVLSRKAFWSFSSHYPTLADNLLASLDAKTQKLLQSGSQGAFGSVKSLKDGYSNNSTAVVASINYDFMDSQNKRMQTQQSSGQFFLFFFYFNKNI